MIIAVHQPQYLAWLGYFDKIDKCDKFVFLDDTQFKKNEWQNRNKIKTKDGWQWLSVPILHDFGQLIKDVKINNKTNWRHKHLNALVTNYSKAPYFKEYIAFFEDFYSGDWENLSALNIELVKKLCGILGIKKEFVVSSQLALSSKGTEHLLEICKTLGAKKYLSGAGGREYLDIAAFRKENIELDFQEFRHPAYAQLHGEFIANLSVVDLLFNCGTRSLEIIRGRNR
ncbi:MAG: WbqC family protein [Candidatus Omnitrophota bacterium]